VLAAGLLAAWSGEVLAQPDEASSEPQEIAVIRALRARIGSLQHFKFDVVDTIDDVLENGQKVQYTHLRSVLVSRPDRLVLESKGDLENRTLVKDGKTVTLIDMDHEVYAQIEFSGTIDEMMDQLLERFDVSTPLADFLGGRRSTKKQ